MRTRRVLIIGPNDSLKVMMAKNIARSINLKSKEKIILGKIYAHSGLDLPNGAPFRAPHHTVSDKGLIGTASPSKLRAGELSLSTAGTLFLNELHEFRKSAIDVIAAALEKRKVDFTIGFDIGHPLYLDLPVDPKLLVATTSMCPCGNLGGNGLVCICNKAQIDGHWKHINQICSTLKIFDIKMLRSSE